MGRESGQTGKKGFSRFFRHGGVICLGLAMLGARVQAEELTWERCLQLALEHNPQLLTAHTRFEQADGQIMQFKARLLPQVRLSGTTLPVQATLQVQQVIWDRATDPGLGIAALGKESAQINLDLTLTEMIYALRQDFLQMIYLSERMQIEKEFVASLTRQREKAPDLFAAGRIPKSAVIRLQVRESLANEVVQETQLELDQARVNLEQLIGVSLAPSLSLEGKIDGSLPAGMDTAALTEYALKNRRDLQLLDTLALSAREQIIVAGSPEYPTFFLFGQFTGEPVRVPRLVPELQHHQNLQSSGKIGPAYSWRIFDGGTTRGNISGAAASAGQAQILAEQTRRDIPGQVAEVLGGLQTAAASLAALQAAPSGQESLQLAEEDYEAGHISQLDLLDAEINKLQQQEAFLTARYNIDLARAVLDRVTGRGIEIVHPSSGAK